MSDKMSPKMFLHRASQAKSAIAFIGQYREWMVSGELASVVNPILAKIDTKELFPTPGLREIQNAVLAHHLASQVRQAEEKITKREVVANVPSNDKNYIARVFDAAGNEMDADDVKFDTDGIRWCDRRLIKMEPGAYGEVSHLIMTDRDGNPLTITVHRDESMGRLLKEKKGPVVRRTGSGLNKPHVWPAKCKQTRSSFSHG